MTMSASIAASATAPSASAASGLTLSSAAFELWNWISHISGTVKHGQDGSEGEMLSSTSVERRGPSLCPPENPSLEESGGGLQRSRDAQERQVSEFLLLVQALILIEV